MHPKYKLVLSWLLSVTRKNFRLQTFLLLGLSELF